MSSRRSLRTGAAVLGCVVLLALLPTAALAGLRGHSHGYRIRIGGGQATLKLPAPAKRLLPFDIACGKRGHEETLVGLAALSGGQRTLSGPSPRPSSRRCIIHKNHHKVATIHLHKRHHGPR